MLQGIKTFWSLTNFHFYFIPMYFSILLFSSYFCELCFDILLFFHLLKIERRKLLMKEQQSGGKDAVADQRNQGPLFYAA